MRNKRYKRLAKRMKGHCLNAKFCYSKQKGECKFTEKCIEVCGGMTIPEELPLRALEFLLKE